MTSLIDRTYAADRDDARQSRKGATLYPRLMVLGSTWVRQDFAGGPMMVINGEDAERLLLNQAEVA